MRKFRARFDWVKAIYAIILAVMVFIIRKLGGE